MSGMGEEYMTYADMVEAKKCYVTVTAMHYINRVHVPQIVETEKGTFMVDRIKEILKMSEGNDLGADERTTVVLGGTDHYLYRKGNRWFMVRSKENRDILPDGGKREWL